MACAVFMLSDGSSQVKLNDAIDNVKRAFHVDWWLAAFWIDSANSFLCSIESSSVLSRSSSNEQSCVLSPLDCFSSSSRTTESESVSDVTALPADRQNQNQLHDRDWGWGNHLDDKKKNKSGEVEMCDNHNTIIGNPVDDIFNKHGHVLIMTLCKAAANLQFSDLKLGEMDNNKCTRSPIHGRHWVPCTKKHSFKLSKIKESAANGLLQQIAWAWMTSMPTQPNWLRPID